MKEEQIKRMVDRFLQWKLPEDFAPDAGISFKRDFNEHTAHPMKHEPTGTNLLTAAQAEAMIRFITDEVSPASKIQKIANDIQALKLHPATSEEYDAGYQAARHDAWLIAQEAADKEIPTAGDGTVLVTVSGLTGSGKSAVMGEIEIALKALGVAVEHDDEFQSEKNMTHADWQEALDLYKPTVVLKEVNIPLSPSTPS